jgi:hypothetical protein
VSKFKVYIKTFNNFGVYKPDFEEITKDVISLGTISQQLDATEYDLGVFRNSGFSIKLRNTDSRYSNVGDLKSIFRTMRADAQVKVTWDIRDNDLICGFFICGEEQVGEEFTIFEGLLSDVASQGTVDDQTIDFKIQGFESLFDKTTVPFEDINDGDLASDIIYACLNQTKITDLITVDALNILPNLDLVIDSVEELESNTLKEMLDKILLITNSVLYIKDRVVYVASRSATADLKYSFYGQASILGTENILDIKKYREGLNRTFNYVTWRDTAAFSRDLTSIQRYGVLKKELESPLIDNAQTAKISSIISSLQTEFAFPKIEMDLETPINYETLALFLLDRVKIDYPSVYESANNDPIPRYGQAIYGEAVYPYGQFTLTISDSFRFKILNKKIDTSKQIISFGLRRI